MALYQALQNTWVRLKESPFHDDNCKSPASHHFTRPSSSNAKSGTSTPLVSVRAASGGVRLPIINVVTAGSKDVRRQVPSTSTGFTTATAAPSASHSNSRWEQEMADGVIDLGGLELSQERRAEVVEAVRAGAQRGFFYITNFGVELELLDQIRAATANFFALPAEEKAKVASATAWETEASSSPARRRQARRVLQDVQWTS